MKQTDTLKGVEAKALRLAQAVVDYDRKDDETRRTSDNTKRLQRLDLGAVICSAPDPLSLKDVIVAKTSITRSEVDDIHAVAEWNIASGYDDWLREINISFTQNRSLAGIKVKTRKGCVLPDVDGRIDALERCIERHDGVFTEDKAFRKAMSILPPPNSVANIIERATEDDEFRKELETQGMYVAVTPEESKPTVPEKYDLDPWVKRINNLRNVTRTLRNQVFDDPNTPPGVYRNVDESIEDLQTIRELESGREFMEAHG